MLKSARESASGIVRRGYEICKNVLQIGASRRQPSERQLDNYTHAPLASQEPMPSMSSHPPPFPGPDNHDTPSEETLEQISRESLSNTAQHPELLQQSAEVVRESGSSTFQDKMSTSTMSEHNALNPQHSDHKSNVDGFSASQSLPCILRNPSTSSIYSTSSIHSTRSSRIDPYEHLVAQRSTIPRGGERRSRIIGDHIGEVRRSPPPEQGRFIQWVHAGSMPGGGDGDTTIFPPPQNRFPMFGDAHHMQEAVNLALFRLQQATARLSGMNDQEASAIRSRRRQVRSLRNLGAALFGGLLLAYLLLVAVVCALVRAPPVHEGAGGSKT